MRAPRHPGCRWAPAAAARPAARWPLGSLLSVGLAIACSLALSLVGCGPDRAGVSRFSTAGDPARGRLLVRAYGCHTCHEIPGVPGGHGRVGPPLGGIGGRVALAGKLQNTPDNLITWIRNPQDIAPGTVMPDMGVSERDARDLAAYLLTTR